MLSLRSFARPPNGPAAQIFRAILFRECARSSRTGRGFSLAVFAAGGGRRIAAAILGHLAGVLAARARESGAIGVGCIDDRRVVAVLPEATAQGALAFVEGLRETMGPYAPAPSCAIFTYPWVSAPCPENARVGDAPPVSRPGIPCWKRTMDALGAAAGLLLLSPLFLLIAAFIKIVSPGPAFFRQERIGYMGKPFTFWKFRTMGVGHDPSVHQRHLHALIHGDRPMAKLDAGRDDRIIPLGRFLRRSCLDELPQLLNVLLGDMSLVGPRPCLPYEAREYGDWHKRRFAAVPGMTGLWQVSGKNRTTFTQMIRHDIAYIRTMSFCLDVKILLKTVPVVLGWVAERGAKPSPAAAGGGPGAMPPEL